MEMKCLVFFEKGRDEMKVLVTLLVGVAGGIVGIKKKVPAGAMLGSMLFVAVYNIFTADAGFPTAAKIMTQTISGIFVGCKITRDEIKSLKELVKPAVLNMMIIIFSCVMMGLFLYKVSDYSVATCMFATAPGSLTDMAIISIDMGADTSVVSVLQTVRLMTILGLFPLIFGILISRTKKNGEDEKQKEVRVVQALPPSEKGKKDRGKDTAITAAVAASCGGAGCALGVPAGALIFSMVGVAAWNLLAERAYMPVKFKQFAQICAGILIGESITVEVIKNLRYTIIPAVIMMLCLLVIVIGLAWILHKTSGLDFPTALFSCAPGGASDLALLAEDFGASTPKVSIIQTLRVVCVVVFYPIIINLLNGLL